ncbi:hypothetical protein RyT2_25000 [Pseudolactococcus yaeyamensis]
MQDKLNNGGDLRVVLFVSRNKDNKNVDSFEQRKETFVSTREVGTPKMQAEFERFVQAGVAGEMSRMYVSVNRRDNSKVVRELQHYLLDNPDTPVARLTLKLASLAAQKQNAAESKWLFDYDADKADLDKFLDDLVGCGLDKSEVQVHPTPNGAAVVVEHGFDTRHLLNKWEDVELKRDDMLLVKWETKKT